MPPQAPPFVTPPMTLLSFSARVLVSVGSFFFPFLTEAAIQSVAESGLGGDAAALLANGFAEDTLAFSDRTHQHNGAAFNGNTLAPNGATVVSLPSYLLGADYVRFANNARENITYSATVTCDVPSDFYLLVDNRLNGPAGDGSSPNTSDPVLGGTLQWVIDGGWLRVNTGLSPGGGPDYTGVDEGGDGTGAGQGLNQFFAVYRSPAPATSIVVFGPQIAGNNMISLVAVPAGAVDPDDTDNDGLPDTWERLHFGDLTQLETGDFDDDGLTNLEEFNTGANPKVKDSDGDGLEDGPEFNLHNTNPTVADTDGDGLTDGEEVNTSLTDPTKADTDGDGLTDFAEVTVHLTDPNDTDSDHDGFSDAVEIGAGSDPNDDGDVPEFSNLDGIIVNEFMASNASTIADADGDFSDWIELWNPTGAPVEITGWHLTDDALNLTKWTFPEHTLAAGQFLVVFASGKDRALSDSQFHTDFQLDKAGGSFLALTRPDGEGGIEIVSLFNPYAKQYEDVSFGYYGATPPLASGYFQLPTPGAANNPDAVQGFVADTTFSVDRGFYDAPIEVTVASATPGASLIYTTDGTLPSDSPANGTRVDAPDADTAPMVTIAIGTTTNLRALAVKAAFEPTNVDTQTYLFRAAILQQSNASVPPHVNWGHAGPDYGMDPDIVNHADPEVRPTTEDFLRVPTLSLTMNWNEMFGSGGIYIAGESVEKATSIEFINPEGDLAAPNLAKGFQVDGTVQITGGSSTGRWKSDKLSMRLKFSPDLRFPVFGQERTDRFDTLVIDNRLNNVWHYNPGSGAGPGQAARAQYTHDQFPADLHNLMGGLSPEGRHCLLYINGVLWGVTELHERPDDNFAAEYLGGKNEDYDAMKHRTSTVVAGSSANYLTLLALTRLDMTDPANYAAVAEILHIDNFIAYMIANYYVGNTDWAHQNWYATYGRDVSGGKWYYHSWDPEHCMENTNENVTGKDDSGGPTEVFVNLIANPEFRLRFADLVHRHFHNGGVLTPSNVAAAYLRRADAVDFVTRIESARWGDNGDSRTTNPYTRRDWLRVRDQLLGTVTGGAWGNYFPSRTGIVFNQFLARGWYPATDAPGFSPHGGTVPGNTPLAITSADGGVIYYTTDGSDPRLAASGGDGNSTFQLVPDNATKFAFMPTSGSLDATWMLSTFDHSGWPAGTLGAGYEISSNGTFDPYIDSAHDFESVVATNTNETIYVRIPFTASNVANLGSMTLNARYDDGFIAYLNGTEILRVNAPGSAGIPLAFDAGASASHADAEAVIYESFDVGGHVALLRNGANVLALHALNQGTGSSDFLLWATLEASEAATGGGGVSPTASVYTAPLNLADSGTVRARVRNNGEWSALTEARFVVGTVPADADNLVVSELNYRPAPPTPAEIAAGHNDRTDFEFVELLNIGSERIDLSGVSFAAGLDFDFATDATLTELAPGARLLIVEDAAAFALRYGAGLPVAGIFRNATQLDNGGETLTLRNALLPPGTEIIRSFAYDDVFPWPTAADGSGFTLTLVAPFSNPDHSLPANWRASAAPNGSPGGTDALGFSAWSTAFGGLDPLGDNDRDGTANLFDYAMLASPLVPSDTLPVVGIDTAGFLTLTYRHHKAADDVLLVPEAGTALGGWDSAQVIAVFDNGDGTETLTARSLLPFNSVPIQFLRLRATLRP